MSGRLVLLVAALAAASTYAACPELEAIEDVRDAGVEDFIHFDRCFERPTFH